MARQTEEGGRHRLKPAAQPAKRNPAAQVEDYPFPHMGPSYPIQKAILAKSSVAVNTLCVQLEDGSWIAVAMRPDNSGFGRTKAEAEESVRRRMSVPAGEDDDALDLAAIELHRHEKMVPLERLVKKYRR
jgi:hypothetical protein